MQGMSVDSKQYLDGTGSFILRAEIASSTLSTGGGGVFKTLLNILPNNIDPLSRRQ